MRQRVATLFVDIAGSTRLLVHHPPEGDGVLLYFGSARRAAEAALAIRAALDRDRCDAGCEGGPGAGVRMSLTIGEAAIGPVGSSGHPVLAQFR